jgi:aminoglycoside phosphotransferase (APT) family kinase protein
VACDVLAVVAPGSTLDRIGPLPGSYSNYTHVVFARSAAGTRSRFVIRRYAVFGSYDRGEKARREFLTLELLREYGIPAPTPLYLDQTGELLGIPGIVTAYVPGRQVHRPPDPLMWARTLAITLAGIHAVPIGNGGDHFLLDADREASWFARTDTTPDYLARHRDGETLWQAVRHMLGRRVPAKPGLVHLDYWPGNVLWQGDTVSAVVDWEEAAYGDPAIDVAYARLNMALDGVDRAADLFLTTYEQQSRRCIENLALWELAAAVRPLYTPASWEIAEKDKASRLRRFIADALAESGF